MGRNPKTITLTDSEVTELNTLIRSGTHKSRTITRAQILLKNHGKLSIDAIAEVMDIASNTVRRTVVAYETRGLVAALSELPRSGRPSKIDAEMEAQVTVLACSQAPEGHVTWTLRMIADKYVEIVPSNPISTETVRKVLKKVNLSLGKSNNGALEK